METGVPNESTEQKIFDAAHEVFMQKGMDGAKMQEIADRAGINKALLHYYYRSKEKLYEMVARAIIGRAVPVIREFLETDYPLAEKIKRFVNFYIELIACNPYVPIFVISEMNKHPDRFTDTILPRELSKPDVFLRQVEAEIAAGRIRPVKPQHLLVNMVSLCIFPFVAKPMLRIVIGMNAQEMRIFLEERKEEVFLFIMASLRPE
ncbi:MAG: TetR/AcrR family transcriptional regulator [Saprospiraceae bacterium]|nr:TetR/AcrR family transcriptional regulator [Saprospiraceae bacterium]